jgi:AcrR family transcriptional regulator
MRKVMPRTEPQKPETLLKRKQQLVRDAIWDAAIDLFATHGFEQVTVDEIAAAAGVSPRSFFRYFASKKDLLAQAVVHYGHTIGEAIEACPKSWSTLEIMQKVILEIAQGVAANPRTRKILRVSEISLAAREAFTGSLATVEDRVAEAFQSRTKTCENKAPKKTAQKDPLRPRLLAAITLSILQVSNRCWAESEAGPEAVAPLVQQAFSTLQHLMISSQR